MDRRGCKHSNFEAGRVISNLGVAVADVGGEEFGEAPLRALAGVKICFAKETIRHHDAFERLLVAVEHGAADFGG